MVKIEIQGACDLNEAQSRGFNGLLTQYRSCEVLYTHEAATSPVRNKQTRMKYMAQFSGNYTMNSYHLDYDWTLHMVAI